MSKGLIIDFILSDILLRFEVWLNNNIDGTVLNPLKYHVSKINRNVTIKFSINTYIIRPLPLNKSEKLENKIAKAE